MASQTVIFGVTPVSGGVSVREISSMVAQKEAALRANLGQATGIDVYAVWTPVVRCNGDIAQTCEVRVSADLGMGKQLGLAAVLQAMGYCQIPQLCYEK